MVIARVTGGTRGSLLEAGTRSAIASVGPTRFFAKYGAQGNSWAIFKTFLDAGVLGPFGVHPWEPLGCLPGARAPGFPVSCAYPGQDTHT